MGPDRSGRGERSLLVGSGEMLQGWQALRAFVQGVGLGSDTNLGAQSWLRGRKLSEFEASLVHKVSSRRVRTTHLPPKHLPPKTTTTKQTN